MMSTSSPDAKRSAQDREAQHGRPPPIHEAQSGLVTMAGDNTEGTAEVDERDIEKQDDMKDHSAPSSRSPSHNDNTQSPPKTVISWEKDDPANPYNWSTRKKTYVLITCILLVMNSTIGSALPSGASQEIGRYFGITSQSLLVLPVSIYLIGYVVGPLVFAPMSEHFGRKYVVLATFAVFTAFNLGCALSPTYTGLVIMRLLTGIGASTPVSVIGGIYADIYGTPKARGRAMTAFMAATTWGPLIGPIISGYVSVVSWRWTFWAMLIISGATWPFAAFLPETYGPVLLRERARKMRKERGDERFVAPVEVMKKQSFGHFCTVVLLRPLRMLVKEWIILWSCLYLSVAYAIFYIYFQAYPIIFQGTYGFSAGEEGLTFIPIGVGAMLAGFVHLYWEHYLERAKARPNPPAWAKKEEYVRLPIACLGAPLFAISLFWLGWTARPGIHWIVPTLSALPFGVGFLLIFMALLNYMVDAYEIYAASALGAASMSRSVFGVVLPFAARPMYDTLGIGWACSLFGFVSIAMGVVPFIFIRYGETIRANSKWCQELKREKAKKEEEQRLKECRDVDGQESVPADPEKQV